MAKDLLKPGEGDEGLEVATKEVTELDLAVETILSGTENEALAVVDQDYDIGEEYSWPKPSAEELEEIERIKRAKAAEMPVELAPLKAEFLEWRAKLLERYFDSKIWPDRSFSAERSKRKIDYEKDKAEFLKAENEELRYRSDLPKADYFEKKIVPLALYMSGHDGKDMMEVAENAFDALQELMRLSTYRGTNKRVHEGVVNGIFEIGHIGHSFGDSCGQYRYFYNKYGKWVAYAVAIHQADISDEHYDGGNYSWGTYKLEDHFGKVAKLVPEQYREAVFKGYVNYGNYFSGLAYLSRLPGTIERIKSLRREDVLPRYFAFLEAAHPIRHEGGTSGFPIFSADYVIEQLDALEKMPKFKEEAFVCAKDIVKYASRYGNECIPLFVDGEKVNADELFGSYYRAKEFHLPEFIAELETAGLSDEQIVKILKFPKEHLWLQNKSLEVMGKYLEIEANFEGGVAALLEYLKTLRVTPESMYSVIEIAASKNYSAEDKALILEVGTTVVESLGSKAGSYFRRFSNTFRDRSNLVKLLKKPDELRTLVERSNKFVAGCPDIRGGGSLNRDYYQELVENFYEHFADKNFEECLRGYELIFDKVRKYLASDTDDEFDGRVFFETIRRYRMLPFELAKKDPFSEEEIPDADFETHARVLIDLATLGDPATRNFGARAVEYSGLLNMGIDPKIAGLAVMANNGAKMSQIINIAFKEYKISERKTRKIFELVVNIREIIGKVSNGKEVLHSEIVSVRRKVEGLDEEAEKFIDKAKFLADLDRVARINFFKGACKIGISDRALDLEARGLMSSSNDSTKMAIAGMSVLLGAGAAQFEGMEDGIVALPLDSSSGTENLGELLMNGKYERKLRENVAMVLPRVERLVLSERARMPGLLPVGGKIHTVKAVDEKLLLLVEKMFGLPKATSFKLIHANHTLLLPPLPSAVELMMMVRVLESFGVIDLRIDELQICAPGRRPEENAAIIGSATLLSRTTGISYRPGAFQSSHDKTGARIMAYDDGVKLNGLPFDSSLLKGRTDILGSRDLTDIGRFQILNTLAAHEEHTDFFAPDMHAFWADYSSVLKFSGLEGTMRESAWVYDNAKEGDSLEQHESMVRRFTDSWMYASGRPDFGIIAGVKGLIETAERQIEAKAGAVKAANRHEFDRLMNY